jgi:hypothetical protein
MNVALEKQAKNRKRFSITCMPIVEYSVEREVSCQLWFAQPVGEKKNDELREELRFTSD